MTQAQIAEARRLATAWQPRTEGKPVSSGEKTGGADRSVQQPSQQVVPSATNDLVVAAQRLLAGLGFNPGPVDGFAGARTREAVRAYQRRKGLTPDGAITEPLVALMASDARSQQAALPSPPEEPTIIATGTAFFVSRMGHLLTSAHVVEKCGGVRLRSADGAVSKSQILAINADDLALLKTDMTPDQAVMFRSVGPLRQGDSVILYGFPLAGLLTSSGNLTTGTIAGLAGLGDDARLMQITAPVQQGNSGGPVFDQSGLVVGIVVGKLDVLSLAGELQDIPQYVNFAIKSSIATNFLEARGVSYLAASRGADRSAADIAESARVVTVQVQCLK